MNRRSRGFTLTELLTALVIHSFFILMLGGIFYTLISFGSRSQMTMTARERGQRVINYIDSRVRRAGLGMWRLESSKEIREALAPLTASGRVFARSDMMFPVMITNYANMDDVAGILTKKSDLTHKTEDEKIICGNVLTLLYAQRETGTDSDSAKLVVQQNGIDITTYTDDVLDDLMTQLENENDFWLEFFPIRAKLTDTGQDCLDIYKNYRDAGKTIREAAEQTLTDKYGNKIDEKIKALAAYSEIIKYVSGYPLLYKYLYNRNNVSYGEFYYSDFGEGKQNNESVKSKDIRTWGVARGAGEPFTVDKYDNSTVNSAAVNRLLTKITPVNSGVTIPNGDELLYLKCVRIFAEAPRPKDKDKEMNLKIQKLNDVKWGTNKSSVNPYQSGILEIYAELNKTKNILSVWVLSSGGRDNMTHERPADWPVTAKPLPDDWKNSDFKYLVTYVSKGTWKLNNLHRNEKDEVDFRWD